MVSRFASNPKCEDCGKNKGPKQLTKMRCFSCQRAKDKKAKEAQHGTYIQATYGIDALFYKALLALQGNRCAICQRATGRTKRLAVDHDHGCEEGHPPNFGCPSCVRGLLCGPCNTFIGRIRDDPRVGDRMARYLRLPPARELSPGQAARAITVGRKLK